MLQRFEWLLNDCTIFEQIQVVCEVTASVCLMIWITNKLATKRVDTPGSKTWDSAPKQGKLSCKTTDKDII